ncbi:MAG: Spy/CpxP family protein refolding chaperone [bacterium]
MAMMRGRWVYILLAVSLAFNLAAVGAFVYHRYRRWRWQKGDFRSIVRRVKPQLAQIVDEYHLKMDSLRIEYWRVRHELARLGFEEKPDSAKVEETLKRIGVIHQQMHRLVFEMGRGADSFLPPPYRDVIRRRCLEVIKGPYPPAGPRRPYHPGRKFRPGRF